MSFWTQSSLSPSRQNRFRVVFTKTPVRTELETGGELAAQVGAIGAAAGVSGAGASAALAAQGKPAPSDYWWWAKSCTLPSFEVGSSEYQLINFKFKYPGMLVWNDVTVTLVEVGDVAKDILSILGYAGYACPGSACGSGIEKSGFTAQGALSIQQLDASGNTQRTWGLRNWFIKGVRFGDQNYESDEFVTLEMTIGYDCATLE